MLINLHTHHIEKEEFAIFNALLEDTSTPCSFGLHPWYIDQYSDESFMLLENLLQKENCFALGECGLDKNCSIDFEKQMIYFERQLLLSEKYQKPVIIHCVKAFQEMIVLKRKLQPQQDWILHGFSKSNVAEQLLAEGFYLSVGVNICTHKKLQETLINIPLNRLFLETDDKKTPISQLYEALSEIKNMNVSLIERQLENNFLKVFNRKQFVE